MEHQELSAPTKPGVPENDVLLRFRAAILSGQHWYLALLDAIKSWRKAEEEVDGRLFRYVIGHEAFDWLLLAERLCSAVDGLVPEEEKTALLLFSKPPLELSVEEFRERIGPAKYCAFLNYLYGITVESALQLAVEREIEKETRARVYAPRESESADAFRRIYGASQVELLMTFQRERGLLEGADLSWQELQEFTYWLFHYRLRTCDKARVASDTRKALLQLQELQQGWSRRLARRQKAKRDA